MEKKKSVKKILLITATVLVAGLFAAFIGFKIYTSHYYVSDETMIGTIQQEVMDEAVSFSDENGSVFIPHGQDIKAVIVFYPGGRVEYTAYSGLLYKLAARGYVCLLPKMTDNLAFLSINAIEKFKSPNGEASTVEDLDWYLAGHSLGGVAACEYLSGLIKEAESAEDPGMLKYKGMILCASYTTSDFSDDDIRFLSILGSNDMVINKGNYEDSKSCWPEDSTEYTIEGGIHSFFGSYGIQAGDGVPSITNEQQLDITAETIDEWIGNGG